MRSLRLTSQFFRKRRKSNRHSGLAATEMAVCLPVVVLVVVASIEACSLIFLQQAIQTTAYETARFAVAPLSTSANAVARGTQVLTDRNVSGGTIAINPALVENVDRGTLVVSTVEAPLSANRLLPEFFYGDQTMTATVTMMRE